MKSTFLSSTAALLLGSCILATAHSTNSTTPAQSPNSNNSVNPVNVTKQCVFSLIGLFGDEGFKSCMPLQQMTKLLLGPPTPEAVNETTEAMCSLPVCSQETVTLVENTIDQNCVPSPDPNKTMIVNNILSLYTPAREGLCQKAANGSYCTTLLAQNLTNYVDANPPPSIGPNMTTENQTEWAVYFSNIPADILCTDCNKAMLTPMDNFIAANQTSFSPTFLGWADKARTEVNNKCGEGFLSNGTAPDNGTTPNQPASQGKEGESVGFVSAQTSLVLGLICSFITVGAQFL